MGRKAVELDRIPEHFASLEEAGEFWDHHDVADYPEETREARFDVHLERRTFLTALEPQLAQQVAEVARRQGVSTETLINVWLAEKLRAVAP